MIRVLLADDHAIVRDGVRCLLARTGDMTIVGEARDGGEVLILVRNTSADVLVLDISMPGRSGIELIRLVKAEYPKLPVLVFSLYDELQYAVRALRAGASGYLTKDNDGDTLVAVIRKLAAGGIYLSETVAEQMAREIMPATEALPHTQLSDREFQVFRLLAEGMSPSAIAERLSLSIKTVSTHKTHIQHKMRLANTADLIHYAIRHQLLDANDNGRAGN
jgi:two-component system invasion response regulator UvrY